MKKYILLIDFGSTYSKFNLIQQNPLELVGQIVLPTSQETGIMRCYTEGKDLLLDKINFNANEDKLEEYFCSSAWGGFKMVVIGFTDTLTRKAAEYAALGSGTRIIKQYYYEVSKEDCEEIERLNPDAILLTGGTNGGNRDFVLETARKLSDYLNNKEVIYAGNIVVQAEIKEIFNSSSCKLYLADNVMPVVNQIEVESVKAIAREIFMRKILHTNGLNEVAKFSPIPIIPTPAAVLNATKIWGSNHLNNRQSSTLVIDVGGATTDVHSYGKGLPTASNIYYEGLLEPELKRSVEGDLGMRESSESVLEQIGIDSFVESEDAEWSREELYQSINKRLNDHKYIADSNKELTLDRKIATFAIKKAMERHVGRLIKKDMLSYKQLGKDMRNCDTLIATGGILIHSDNPRQMIEESLKNNENVLNPVNPTLYLDQKYLLSAIGVFGQVYPDQALALMKRYLHRL